MLITEVVGNLAQHPELADTHKEKVYVENEALAKRLHQLESDHGTEVNVRLGKGKHLHVGDILVQTDNNLIVVDVLPEEVLVILPDSMHTMGVIAHELGNRHLPAQFFDDTMVVQYDYLVEHLLQQKAIAYRREALKLNQPFRHIGHSHD